MLQHCVLLFLLISASSGAIKTSLELEYFIQEELPIGYRVGNILDDIIPKISDLGEFRSNEATALQPDSMRKQLSFSVTNYGDPGVDLFEVRKDGSLIIAHRVDREKLCPAHKLPSPFSPSVPYMVNADIYHSGHPDSDDFTSFGSLKCPVPLHYSLSFRPLNTADSVTTLLDEKIMLKVVILVEDINDNPPQWPEHLKRYQVTFRDGDPVDKKHHLPSAYDEDVGENARLVYELLPTTVSGTLSQIAVPFRLMEHASDGLYLIATKPIDREEQTMYQLYLQATDRPGNQDIKAVGGDSRQFTSRLIIDIKVEDINDNAPVFSKPLFTPREFIPETTPPGQTVLTLNATDADSGINGAFHFGFSQQHAWSPTQTHARQYFDVRSNGHIVVRRPLNVDQAEVKPYNSLVPDQSHQTGFFSSSTSPSTKAVSEFRFRVVVEDEAVRPYSRSSEALVVILVSDENDEAPVVKIRPVVNSNVKVDSHQRANLHVSENQRVGTPVAVLEVYDPDFRGSDKVECHVDNRNFTLTPTGPMRSELSVNQNAQHLTTYQVVTGIEFDREATQYQLLPIICSDFVGHSTLRNLTVYITDQNDHSPRFALNEFNMVVGENSPRGTQLRSESNRLRVIDSQPIRQQLHHLLATDLDEGLNAQLIYHLKASDDAACFTVDPHTGALSTNLAFDRETKKQYTLQAMAIDQGNPPLTGSTIVKVTILDVNDNIPKFSQPEYIFQLLENQPRTAVLGQVKATDPDDEGYYKIAYYLSNDKDAHNFHIDRETGVIRTQRPLDREIQERYHFLVFARDATLTSFEVARPSTPTSSLVKVQHTGTSSVVVIVEDLNDNWPVFLSPNATANTLAIAIDETLGHQLAYIHAVDADSGENGAITYHIRAGNQNGLFGLDAESGLLYLASTPNQKLFLPQDDHNYDKLDAENGTLPLTADEDPKDNVKKDDKLKNELLQKNSYIHLLTLEACDKGSDPQPKCTLFNNLKIFINFPKDAEVLDGYQDKDIRKDMFGNQARYLESAAVNYRPSRVGAMSGYDIHSYDSSELSHGKITGSVDFSSQPQRYNVNEIITVCLSMIFVFILLATIGMACLLRRRSSGLWKKPVVEANISDGKESKADSQNEVLGWQQPKDVSAPGYTRPRLSWEPYQRSITNVFASSTGDASELVERSPPTTRLVEGFVNTNSVRGSHVPGYANHYHHLTLQSDGSVGSPLTMMQSDNAVFIANRDVEVQQPLSSAGLLAQLTAKLDKPETKFLKNGYMGSENNYHTLDYLGLFSSSVPSRYPYLYGNQRCLLYSPATGSHGTSRKLPSASPGVQQSFASSTSESVPLTHLNHLTNDVAAVQPFTFSKYRSNHCHSLSQPQSLELDRYASSSMLPHSPSATGLINSKQTNYYPQTAGPPQDRLQPPTNQLPRNQQPIRGRNQAATGALSPVAYDVYHTRKAVQSHTYHDIRQPDQTNYAMMPKSRSQQLNRFRMSGQKKYLGTLAQSTAVEPDNADQFMRISQTLTKCDIANATLDSIDDETPDEFEIDKPTWKNMCVNQGKQVSSEMLHLLAESVTDSESKRLVTEAYREASFV